MMDSSPTADAEEDTAPGSPSILDPSPPNSPGVIQDNQDQVEAVIVDEASNEAPTVSYYSENSNSSVTTIAVWNTDHDAPEIINNEDSNFSLPSTSGECSSKSNLRKSDTPLDEPPSKMRKVSHDEEVDGETCPICLESWGNSSDHRLVALKCGHLFGLHCVERWLKARPLKDRACPTCKAKAAMKDIRHIYARRLVAADTSELALIQKQLDTVQEEKNRVELELQKSKIAHRACLQEIERLRSKLCSQATSQKRIVKRNWRFALEKNLEVCKDKGCRVMAYNCRTYELYVSQKSSNSLFPGYGIRKVNCVDCQLGQFINLHPKPIRDMAYSQPRDLLLSVGLDSCGRVWGRGAIQSTVQAGFPLWSCTWDALHDQQFYVGGVGGQICQYDMRNLASCVQRLSVPVDMSPVMSLYSTEFGLLSCHLTSCWLWVPGGNQWTPQSLPVEGPFTSLSYDSESRRALISRRPSLGGQERARLSLCKLQPEIHSCYEEYTFPGSTKTTFMSRSAFVKVPESSWVAAHSESDSMLYLHGLDGAKTISLQAKEPALDVASVQINGETILAALSESRLRIYKALPVLSVV